MKLKGYGILEKVEANRITNKLSRSLMNAHWDAAKICGAPH